MKRLVICCDGTWNKPESDNVTNIEKIARTVQTDLRRTGGVQQLVQYVGGVGANWYWVDRVLGGAFGFGLFEHVTRAYRFLALNYEPGDEIFVFGFSRGAYTARSLVGMMTRVGLITREALVADKLPEAVNRYRGQPARGRAFGSSNEEFRHDNCHPDLRVDFLGVFDTVGALGVPGAIGSGHTFHDVRLSPEVIVARQALAIDERRIKFEPCLWEVEKTADSPGRVKQLWFEGAHSDVGGGYATTGLSDTALLWMLQEANMQGLVFDTDLLSTYVASNSPAERHSSLTLGYRLLNLVDLLKNRITHNTHFRGSWRRLDGAEARDVRIASSAQRHWEAHEGYDSPNIGWFKAANGDVWSERSVLPVIALPEPPGTLDHLLEEEHVDLAAANPPRVTLPIPPTPGVEHTPGG
ncbi:MAG: DUF2235 domain-containing protein [Nocardioidaceae bacterium]